MHKEVIFSSSVKAFHNLLGSLRSNNKTIILENNVLLLYLFQASLGTTKYCSYFLKSMQCPKPDCMYLHELGDEAASFTKEEMQVKTKKKFVFLKCILNVCTWPCVYVMIKGLREGNACYVIFPRRVNIKSTSRNSSKTSIKLTLAFYNLLHVEQRSQRANPTPHRGEVSFCLLSLSYSPPFTVTPQ